MQALEASLIRRVAIKLLTFAVAKLCAFSASRLGVTLDPHQVLGAAFLGLDLLRHDAVQILPGLAPWLG